MNSSTSFVFSAGAFSILNYCEIANNRLGRLYVKPHKLGPNDTHVLIFAYKEGISFVLAIQLIMYLSVQHSTLHEWKNIDGLLLYNELDCRLNFSHRGIIQSELSLSDK